jgi:hypothetical protein
LILFGAELVSASATFHRLAENVAALMLIQFQRRSNPTRAGLIPAGRRLVV